MGGFMGKAKLILYNPDDINSQLELIRHNNAFILADGNFYLAKGYTGCNPCHQLESSALTVLRKKIGYDIKKAECENYLQGLGINYRKIINDKTKYLYYLGSILIHYYGYALFARQELISSYKERNRFFDCSLIPNPKINNKEITALQTETLEKLFDINDDKTVIYHSKNETSKDVLKKVLSQNEHRSEWYY
jgi:hypothetical protein